MKKRKILHGISTCFYCISCHSIFLKDTYLLLILRATFIFTVWPGSNFIPVQRQPKDYELQIKRRGIGLNTSAQLTHNKENKKAKSKRISKGSPWITARQREKAAYLYAKYLPRIHFQPSIQLTGLWCLWSKKNFACFSVSHFDWKVTHLTAFIYGLKIQMKFYTIK